ncbi:Ras guanine nucleotide exchange factor F [Diplonema papillatum]|nr:Ras guanine nucleotide exchange factor F [Diplonema papillatum]
MDLFESMVRLQQGTGSAGYTLKSDGVRSVVDGHTLFVYGGPVADKVMALSLGQLKWTQVQCSGLVPPPRTYHSAATFGGNMLVYGGIEQKPASDDYDPTREDPCPYYELDLDTFEWLRVQTFGTGPGPRSHHTAVVADGKMLVLGGQDLSKGVGRSPTNADLHESKLNGFFDMHVLDVPSRTWTQVPRSAQGVDTPQLWGHTASICNHYMLVYGGFDVAGDEEDGSTGVITTHPESPPNCTVNEAVYICDLRDFSWKKSTPRPGLPSPPPRTLHDACCFGADLLVFGGMTFDAAGRAAHVNDAWIWDVPTGFWRKVEFCAPYWPSKELIHAEYEGKLVVCPSLLHAFVLDFRNKPAGFVKYPTDPSLALVNGASNTDRPGATWQTGRDLSPSRYRESVGLGFPDNAAGTFTHGGHAAPLSAQTSHAGDPNYFFSDPPPAQWDPQQQPYQRPEQQQQYQQQHPHPDAAHYHPGFAVNQPAAAPPQHYQQPQQQQQQHPSHSPGRSHTPTYPTNPPLDPYHPQAPPPPPAPAGGPGLHPNPNQTTMHFSMVPRGYPENSLPGQIDEGARMPAWGPGGAVGGQQASMYVDAGSAGNGRHAKDLRVQMEEEMRARSDAMAAQSSLQTEHVRKLKGELAALQNELADLAKMKERVHTSTMAANDSSFFSSPSRKREEFVPPIDTPAAAGQYRQIDGLKDYLGRLQTHQHSLTLQQKKKHQDYLEDLKRSHEYHVKMLTEQQASQRLAQEKLTSAKAAAEEESTQYKELDAMQKQYDSLLDLTQSRSLPSPTKPAKPGLPSPAEDMAAMIQRLARIPSYHSTRHAPSPSPTWPAGVAGQRAALHIPLAQALGPRIPRHEPPPLSRKEQHIDDLRHALQAMDQSPLRRPAQQQQQQLSPPRPGVAPYSVASSSPGRYWDQLKEVMGDDYGARGYSASPGSPYKNLGLI